MQLFLFILSIFGLFALLMWRSGHLGPLIARFRRPGTRLRDVSSEIARLEAEIETETARTEDLQRLLDAKRRLLAARQSNEQLTKAISAAGGSSWSPVAPPTKINRGSAYRRSR